MVATRPGDDPTPRAGEGGPRRTTAQLASDPAFTGTYVPRSSAKGTATYDAAGNLSTFTETDTGAVITYGYDASGNLLTESRALGGVTTLRTFTYDASGNLTGVS